MTRFPSILFALACLASADLAQSAPLTSFNGDHFSVTYDSTQTGIYGPGYLSGSLDTFYFQPTVFTAFSAGSPVLTSASLQFTLVMDAGYRLGGLEFNEWGNYFLSNAGMTKVAADVQVHDTNMLTASTLGLQSGLSLDQSGSSVNWALSGLIAPPSTASQILQITLNNDLTSAPVGGIGFIQKSYTGFKVLAVAVADPMAVPEPSSWTLVLAGALAASLVGRRRMSVLLTHARLLRTTPRPIQR